MSDPHQPCISMKSQTFRRIVKTQHFQIVFKMAAFKESVRFSLVYMVYSLSSIASKPFIGFWIWRKLLMGSEMSHICCVYSCLLSFIGISQNGCSSARVHFSVVLLSGVSAIVSKRINHFDMLWTKIIYQKLKDKQMSPFSFSSIFYFFLTIWSQIEAWFLNSVSLWLRKEKIIR